MVVDEQKYQVNPDRMRKGTQRTHRLKRRGPVTQSPMIDKLKMLTYMAYGAKKNPHGDLQMMEIKSIGC
ncbi:hypothetical protein F9C07_4655 [Aspergillus flavus]|uniref:Uncharacterized protein n=1 Tax=Aspergillus flavus (strain ATCC 200026 / FGSC A1120 / IAM 13836 / NRRL 3357 / JCM 12722 / SRRC 167) TaxID=332952 RepID=A0A7U2MKW5_ASPFN|nr:hypothetical protein F9C07_4655 [Aspergillus flavus]